MPINIIIGFALILLAGYSFQYFSKKKKVGRKEEEKYRQYKTNRDMGAPEDPTVRLLNMEFYPQNVTYPAERRYKKDLEEERIRIENEEKHLKYVAWLENQKDEADDGPTDPPEDEILFAGDVFGWDDLDDMGSDEPF